jgi:hypothetical protein
VTQYASKSNRNDFWLEIVGLMNYAAKVEDSSTSTPILTQALDMVDAIMTKNTSSWPNSPGRDCSSSQVINAPHNTIVGLAAQFAVLPYVREKVRAQPQLLLSKPGAISLLENAVFDYRYFVDNAALQRSARTLTSTITSRRIELVRFLLETNPNISHVDRNGVQLVKIVRSRPYTASPCVDREGEAVDYWDAVAALLTEKKKPIKRSTAQSMLKGWIFSR